MRNKLLRFFIGLVVIVFLPSCQEETVSYTEVKNIDEKITEAELQQFLRVVERLPKKKLPEFPAVLLPLPQWNASRTLPVDELVGEEQERLGTRWSVEWLAKQLLQHQRLSFALQREGMTRQQFAAMILALGTSLLRSTLNEQQELSEILKKGQKNVEQLRSDQRVYSKLESAVRYSVLRRAKWLTRISRAKRLKLVPPENVALVRSHRDVLQKIFPHYFLENPFNKISDILEEQGAPFTEMPVSGFDKDVTWNRDGNDAIIGTDLPDALPEKKAGK